MVRNAFPKGGGCSQRGFGREQGGHRFRMRNFCVATWTSVLLQQGGGINFCIVVRLRGKGIESIPER